MPNRALNNLGLNTDWDLGEDGWKAGMDYNLLLLDTLAQPRVIDIGQNSPPGSPSAGDVHVVGTSPSGDWLDRPNAIAVYDDGAWTLVDPLDGWRVHNLADGRRYKFDGTTWKPTRPLNNLTATAAPSANDDETAGYEPLSVWVDTAATEFYKCLDATTGAAVWVKSSLTIDELGALALGNDAADVPYAGPVSAADVAAAIDLLNGEKVSPDRLRNEYAIRPPLSVKPTLSLDFANNEYEVYDGLALSFQKKGLSDVLSVTRSTVETGVTATGLIGEVAANELPLVFDPETGESLGAQITGEYTNLLLWSEKYDEGSWAKSAAAVTALAGTSVVGGTQWEVECTADGSFNGRITQSVGTLSGWNTAYFIVKRGNTSTGAVTFETSGEGGRRLWVDLETGAIQDDVGASGGNFDYGYTIKSLADGYFLIGISMNITVAGTTTAFVWAADPGESNASTGNSILVAAAQVVVGESALPYVKTESAQVTKSDSFIQRSLGSEWNPDEFTVLSDLTPRDLSTSARALSIGSGATDRIELINSGLVTQISGGTTRTIAFPESISVGQRYRVAYRFTRSEIEAFIDGISVGSVSVDNATLGASSTFNFNSNAAGSSRSSLHLHQFQLVPKGLSAQEISAWTTPPSTT